ncbi:MAG: hypothetical protein IJQ87_00960 [Clostridia bacterium]|nr:hypothetical protein [Clostridia bacterium]
MKKWQISKAILYLVSAVLIFIFNKSITPYAGILVGTVVCVYAFEELIISAARKKLFSDTFHLFDGIAQILIGAILFLVSSDIVKVCLVWGVWSILRKSKELAAAVKSIITKRFGFLSFVESIVVIVLSFVMILEPTEHHANLHAILLGVELITVVLFYFMENFIDGKRSANSENKKDELTI